MNRHYVWKAGLSVTVAETAYIVMQNAASVRLSDKILLSLAAVVMLAVILVDGAGFIISALRGAVR